MSIFAYGNTEQCSMEINEDSYFIKKIGDYIVLMVADGNGSSKGMINPGAMAITVIGDYLEHIIKPNTSILDIYNQIDAGMFAVSRCFLSINALDEKYSNIYSSLTVCIIEEISMNMVLASIGNTEVLLIRNGQLTRVNKLHSEAFNLFKKGDISESELYTHPRRAILTSALGVFTEIDVDILKTQLMKEDILLFSTDGLYRCLTPQGVLETLAANGDDIPKAVNKILSKAKELENPDNTTLICLYVQDDNGVAIEKNYTPSYNQPAYQQQTQQSYNKPKQSLGQKQSNQTNLNNNTYDPYGGYTTPAVKKNKKKYLY